MKNMSDFSTELDEQIAQNPADPEVAEETAIDANVENDSVCSEVLNENTQELEPASASKMSKKKLGIISAIAAVVVVVLMIVFIPSKFDKVEKECLRIAGQLSSGKNYFSLDTDPYEDMDETLRAILLPDTQENALEAIKYANKELGFDYVYSEMMKTTALMGRLSEENSKYKVSWTYHPDRGLEVTYTKK